MSLPYLSQRFKEDFDELIAGLLPGYNGRPYAFVRFGDGEAAIVAGRKYQTAADGWKYPGGYSELSRYLCDSLTCMTDGYYLGLPSPTFERAYLEELMPLVRAAPSQITWAKIFCDRNFVRFKEVWPKIQKLVATVGCGNVDHFVPCNSVEPFIGVKIIDRLLDALREERRPIVVSAGPIANIIVHRYWMTTPPENRRTIIDIGSVTDQSLKGKTVREYSRLKHDRFDWRQYLRKF